MKPGILTSDGGGGRGGGGLGGGDGGGEGTGGGGLGGGNVVLLGERIIAVAHKHPFVVQGALFRILFFGMGVPGAGYMLFKPFYPLWGIWGSIGILLFIYEWLKWYLDAWIVTNYAVIDQDWVSYFNKTTSRIEYQSIAGISTETRGFWGTILGFGNIQIEHVSAQPILH
jgi:hypothetical protein